MATRSKVKDWLLWMVIAHASLKGYCVTEPIVFLMLDFVASLNLYSMLSHFTR